MTIIRHYSPLFATVRPCSPLFATVRHCSPCSPLFATVRHCSPLFATVRHCSPLFATVRHCSPLFATVRHCSPLFETIRTIRLFGFSRHPTFCQNRLLGRLISRGLCHLQPRLILRYYLKYCFSVQNMMSATNLCYETC